MKALILVGGFGTRLRPLTLTLPKPLVEFANQPIILHQIEALVNVGVKHIVLAVNYRPELMVSALQEYAKKYAINIEFSIEDEPLGTAGPIALAAKWLSGDDSPFFVLNSDVICSFPLQEMIQFHTTHKCEGTLLVTKVEEPSKYGVVVLKSGGETLIDRFVEKPQVYVGNRINAGIYLFNVSILKRISAKPTSLEKEIFPSMASDGQLHAMDLKGFWMDIGQPKDYLTGLRLYLNYVHPDSDARPKECTVIGNNLIHKSVKIGGNCRIGPNVSIAEGVTIEDGVSIRNSAIFANAHIGKHSWIDRSIVGWNSKVGSWARLENVCVLGESVSINDEVYVNGGCILPHKNISNSVPEPQIII